MSVAQGRGRVSGAARTGPQEGKERWGLGGPGRWGELRGRDGRKPKGPPWTKVRGVVGMESRGTTLAAVKRPFKG